MHQDRRAIQRRLAVSGRGRFVAGITGAAEIRRNDPLIAALIQILGWTTEQADALFTSANAIQNS
jgi:hypothetical protein